MYGVITEYLRDSLDCMDMQEIARRVELSIRQFLDVALMGIFLNDNGDMIRIIPEECKLPDYFIYNPDAQQISRQVIETGMQISCPIDRAYSDKGIAAELKRAGGRNVLSLPVIYHKKLLAALTLVLKQEEPPTEEQLEFCTTICGFLSVQLKKIMEHQDFMCRTNCRSCVESDLDAIFSGSVDLIGIFSQEGYLKRINPTFERRLGYSQRELFSKPITAFAHPDDRHYVRHVLEHIKEEGAIQGLYQRFMNRDGKILYLEFNVSYMAETGDIIAIARDLTNQREMEEKNLALEESIAMERMKTEFFSNVSHEFKTPINIIMSSVDLLKLKLCRDDRERYEQQYKKFFLYMEQNSLKLLRLINNLMDCTKLDNGAMKLLLQDCPIVPFVRQVVETTESYASTHNITISFQTDVLESYKLSCDPDKVDRILLNLISNSIKYTPKGGNILVSLNNTPTHLQLSVADDGEGIPEAMLPHIFEKFRVYTEGFVKSCDGTGVGLSIVKGLTELHEGTVSVKSTRGKGAIFIVTFSKKLKERGIGVEERLLCGQQDDMLLQSRLQMEMANVE